MSLITRCPTCETMFRVVPDQLRVSEGWVRCGQCAEVFDATQHMVASPEAPVGSAVAPVLTTPSRDAGRPASIPTGMPSPPIAPATPPAFGSPSTMATANASTTAAGIRDAHAVLGSGPGTGQATGAFDAAAMATDTTNRGASTSAADFAPTASHHANDRNLTPTTLPTDRDEDWPDAPISDPQSVILPTEDDAQGNAQEAVDTVPPEQADARAADILTRERTAEAAFAQPSFLRNDSRQASLWRRPAMRIALLAIVLVLLALLGAQFLVKERNKVAAMEPTMRPMLLAVCAVAGCTLDPLRQIESIVIDSSSFSRVRDSNYHLGFSLKNTAPIDVAMPAIELSLTDPQDRPVIRRVILPAEFGAPSGALARSSVWNGSLALGVQPGVGEQRIAGYRLLAFYP